MRVEREALREEGGEGHIGEEQRQLRPRRVDGRTQQVARCAPVHSAGSQLPLRVLWMYLCRAPEMTRRR